MDGYRFLKCFVKTSGLSTSAQIEVR